MPVESQITTISPEQLDDLFKDVPETTPSANDLIVGKDNPENPIVTNTSLNIPQLDLEELERQAAEPEKKEETKKEEKKEEQPKVEEKKEEIKEEEKSTPDDIKGVLKNTVNYLIESGLWNDFEGREEIEFDEKTYSELAAAQQTAKASELFDELLDSTGDYGKAIITHIKNGGNPEDVIDIFKEQKEVQTIDTKTDEGKLELIGKYYSEVVGWKPERIKRHLKGLLDSTEEGELDTEVSDIQERYDEYYQKQLQEVNKQQEETKAAELRKQEAFKTNIKDTISKREDLTSTEKKVLEKSILDFRHKLPNGTVVNDFYVKFAQMQSDPKQYVDLVQFVTDRKAYDAKIVRNLKTETNSKAFNFVKGNNAVKKTGSPHTENVNSESQTKLDFSTLLRKK